MSCSVELFLLEAAGDAVVLRTEHPDRFQPTAVVDCPAGLDPSTAAHSYLADRFGVVEVLHSTSWRFAKEQLILSFAVVLDAAVDPAHLESVAIEPFAPADPSGPPSHHDVVSHAVRHLAFLQQSGEVLSTETWATALRGYQPALAGEIHRVTLPDITATVSCLYSVVGGRSGRDVGNSDRISPHDLSLHTLEQVGPPLTEPTIEADRRSPEYLANQHPVAAYRVLSSAISRFTFPHMPTILKVTLDISAPEFDGLVQILKDLYDPETDLTIDGTPLRASLLGADHSIGMKIGHRGIVAHVTSLVPSAHHRGVQALVMQMLAKDLAIEFDPGQSSLVMPPDLNGPVGAEILMWAESTVIWKLPQRLDSWRSGLELTTALGVALRQTCDDVADLLVASAAATDDDITERLEQLSARQLLFSQATSGVVDGYSVRLGKQHRTHLDAYMVQSGADLARDRTVRMLRHHVEALRLEQEVRRDRKRRETAQAAKDLTRLIRAFATASVALAALSVGQASIDPTSANSFARAIAVGLVVLIAICVVGIAVAISSSTAAPRAARFGQPAAAMALMSGAAVLAVEVTDVFDGLWSTATYPIGLLLILVGALGYSWTAHLGGPD